MSDPVPLIAASEHTVIHKLYGLAEDTLTNRIHPGGPRHDKDHFAPIALILLLVNLAQAPVHNIIESGVLIRIIEGVAYFLLWEQLVQCLDDAVSHMNGTEGPVDLIRSALLL